MKENEPRWALIRHLRHQIAAGTYVTTGRLEVVASKLLGRLQVDRGLVDDKQPRGKVEGNPRRRL